MSGGAKTIATTNSGSLTNPASLTCTASAAGSLGNFVTLTAITGLTQSTDGSGFDYTPTTTTGYGSGYATTSGFVPAGADGYYGATNLAATAEGLMVGLKTSGTNAVYNGNLNYGIYADTGGPNWQVISAGAGGQTAQTSVIVAAGDIGRVRRSGTTVVGEVSKNGGSTWTTIYTWTSVSAANLYGYFQCSNTANAIKLPFCSTNAS